MVAKKYRDVQRILRAHGWRRLRAGRGSHEIWEAPDNRQVTLASGGARNREVPAGTLSEIRRQTGIEELR